VSFVADIRIPPLSTPPVRTPAPQAARSAQQAFFQAAMGREQTPPPAAAPAPKPTTEVAPQRPMRPGSLLDIKV
jgi:hypothetical protein